MITLRQFKEMFPGDYSRDIRDLAYLYGIRELTMGFAVGYMRRVFSWFFEGRMSAVLVSKISHILRNGERFFAVNDDLTSILTYLDHPHDLIIGCFLASLDTDVKIAELIMRLTVHRETNREVNWDSVLAYLEKNHKKIFNSHPTKGKFFH